MNIRLRVKVSPSLAVFDFAALDYVTASDATKGRHQNMKKSTETSTTISTILFLLLFSTTGDLIDPPRSDEWRSIWRHTRVLESYYVCVCVYVWGRGIKYK